MQLHTWFDWVVVIVIGTFTGAVLLGSIATAYGSIVKGTLEFVAFTVGTFVALAVVIAWLANFR